MSNGQLFDNNSSKGDGKSIWSKPEGIGLIVIGIIICCGLFYAWGEVVPFVQRTLALTFSSLWYFIGLLATVGVLLWVLTSKELRALAWNVYRIIMRGIAGCVIEMNPIAILKNTIEDMRAQKEKLDKNRDELEGARVNLKNKIDQNNENTKAVIREAEAAKAKMDAAQAAGDQLAFANWQKEFSLRNMKGGGLQKMNEKLIPLHVNMQKMCDFLSKASGAADFSIRRAEIDVELKEAEWNAVQKASSALSAAMSIFKGNPDQRALFEQAVEYMQTDMANKVGEMKRIMEVSTSIINSSDLENDAAIMEGMQMLDTFMSGDTEFAFITEATVNKSQKALSNNAGMLGQGMIYRSDKERSTISNDPNSRW